MLADVPIDAAWSGPIDRSPHGFPLFGRLGGREHILYGVGWSGNGVGPSLLGGRILAAMALGDRRRVDALAARGRSGRLVPARSGALRRRPSSSADAVVRMERAAGAPATRAAAARRGPGRPRPGGASCRASAAETGCRDTRFARRAQTAQPQGCGCR